MKTILIMLIVLTIASCHTADKKSLLIGTWKQFAIKEYSQSIDNASAPLFEKFDTCSDMQIIFYNDSNCEVDTDSTKLNGNWGFNKEQTKIGYTLNRLNGVIDPLSIYDTAYLIKLSPDTLLYKRAGYIINTTGYNKEYYFVKEK